VLLRLFRPSIKGIIMRLRQNKEFIRLFGIINEEGMTIATPVPGMPGVFDVVISPRVQELRDLQASLIRSAVEKRQRKNVQRRLALASALASAVP
jgi:hypothetical protein